MYKKLFSTMELGVVYHDADGKLIELNPAATKILGIKKSVAEKLDSYSLEWDAIKEDGSTFYGDDHPAIQALKTGKRITNVVMGIIHQKDKTRRWIKINAVPEFKEGKEKPFRVYATFYDITDEKLAKDSLKENEESLQRAFDVATLGHWKLNLKTLEYTWSDFAKTIIGYNEKKKFPSNTDDYMTLLYPEDLSFVIEEIKKSELIGEFQLEHRLFINKKTKWVRVKSKVTSVVKGVPSYAIGTIRDITEEKENEIALKESQERFQALIENAPDAVYLYDTYGRIQLTNNIASKQLGYSKEELLEKTLKDLDPYFDNYKYSHEAMERMSINEPCELVSNFLKKDKTFLPVEIKYTIIEINKKKHILAYVRDITLRKKVEDEIRNSRAQLTSAMVIARVGHWEYDVEKDILTISDQLYSIYRTSAEKVGGNKISASFYIRKFVHPEDRNFVEDEFFRVRDVKNKGYDNQLEHRVINGDGNIIFILVHFFIIQDEKGKAIKSLGANLDISDRKKNEDELRIAKEKAEENDRLKTAFLNNMSHEIRTPLNVIMGYTGLLNEIGHNENNVIKKYTEPIARSAIQLKNIIEDILNLSRIETGQLFIKKEDININEIVLELVEAHKLSAEKKKIKLSYSKKNIQSKATVITDKVKLLQILNNLISNAVKYTDEGYVKIGVMNKPEKIEFMIEDTGRGIDPKYHSRIFERFQRLEIERSDNYHSVTHGGTGLGLAISKGLVELLGGKIWLESETGKGTVFYFDIPKTTV